MQTNSLLDFEYRDNTNSMHVRVTEYVSSHNAEPTYRVSFHNTLLCVQHEVEKHYTKEIAYQYGYDLQRRYVQTLVDRLPRN